MEPGTVFSRRRIERLLRIRPETKPEVYIQIFEAADLSSLQYWLELAFSAGIATLGLVLNSPAVVIGAMLISPLMGPIIAAGLALAAADLYLGLKSLANIVASVAAAVLFSWVLVWLLPFHTVTSEILSRTRPNLLDLGVALLSGLAGSMLVIRGPGGSSALPGVAIAVALMPPLCTAGFGFGSGFNWTIIGGASLLFLTNLAAIIASAFLVFLALRMDSPDVRARIDHLVLEHASRTRIYGLLQSTRLARQFGDIGKLQWRILMLVGVLGILFLPLKHSLVQVRDEAVVRSAARDAIHLLASPESILMQQIDPTAYPEPVRVHLVVTGKIDADKISAAEKLLLRRTGRDARLTVRQVAGQEEIARIRESLAVPAPPPVQDFAAIRADVLSRIDGPLRELWPADSGTIKAYEFGFSATGIVLRIQYDAPESLPAVVTDVLTRGIGSRLGIQNLEVVLENLTPPAPKKIPRPSPRRLSRP